MGEKQEEREAAGMEAVRQEAGKKIVVDSREFFIRVSIRAYGWRSLSDFYPEKLILIKVLNLNVTSFSLPRVSML